MFVWKAFNVDVQLTVNDCLVFLSASLHRMEVMTSLVCCSRCFSIKF